MWRISLSIKTLTLLNKRVIISITCQSDKGVIMREFLFSTTFTLLCGGYLVAITWRLYRWFSFKSWAQVTILAASVVILTYSFHGLFGYGWRNVDTYLTEYGRDAHLSAIILYLSLFLMIMTFTWLVQASVREQRRVRHSGLSRG